MSRQIPSIPRLQTLLNSVRFLRDPLAVISQNIKAYGDTYVFYLGGVVRALFTADPAFIQHVLQKNHRNYQKSPTHFRELGHFVGFGLLTIDGDHWLRQRRLIQPGFHKSRLQNLTHLMNGVIQEKIAKMEKQASAGPLDMTQHMMELAFGIIIQSIFSTAVPDQQLQEISDKIMRLQAFVIRLIRQPYLHWWLRASGQYRQHELMAAELDEIILGLIRYRRASGKERDDLLQMLLDARYEDNGEPMSEQQLLDEVKILFVAGHETSANALAWAFYLLGQNPDKAVQLQAELDAVLAGRRPNFDDLPQLPYLAQVVNEVLRCYPPAWITDRLALADDEFNGVKIAKGSIVATYIYGAHHAPEHWERADQFLPERFAKGANWNSAAYLPFGSGPRMCIGNHFAVMEMQLSLAHFFQHFHCTLKNEQPVGVRPLITLRPEGPIWVELTRK